MSENPEISKIEEILNKTIRPHIKSDGGDIEIVGLEGNVLTINYKGACSGCPMATQGTLQAIQQVLRENYKPDIEVQTK